MRFLLTVREGEIHYEALRPPRVVGPGFCAFHGALFNAQAIAADLGVSAELTDEDLTCALLERHGFEGALARMHGAFTLISFDGVVVSAGTDPSGEHYFYWSSSRSSGGDFLLASDPAIVPESAAPLDGSWITAYFGGEDSPGETSPLKGIRRLRAGESVAWDSRTGEIRLHTGRPLAPEKVSCLDEAVERVEKILRESLRSVCRFSRAPHAFVSCGVDSATLLALLRAEAVPFSASSHVRAEYAEELFPPVRAAFAEYDRPAEEIRSISGLEISGFIEKGYFLQPCFHTWYVPFIYYGAHLRPAFAAGADLVLTGNVGDDILLHRYRYVVADLLERNPDERAELRGLMQRGENFEALRRARALYPPVEEYAHSPTELGYQELRRMLEVNSNLPDFAWESNASVAGRSDDRPHRLYSGKNVVSIFADPRILAIVLGLPAEERARALRTAGLQNALLKKLGRPHGHFRKEASRMRYITNAKLIPRPEADWSGMIRELAHWNHEQSLHFERVLAEDPVEGANVEMFRLWSFFLWLENRRSRAGAGKLGLSKFSSR